MEVGEIILGPVQTFKVVLFAVAVLLSHMQQAPVHSGIIQEYPGNG